jgi:hypothetical protein
MRERLAVVKMRPGRRVGDATGAFTRLRGGARASWEEPNGPSSRRNRMWRPRMMDAQGRGSGAPTEASMGGAPLAERRDAGLRLRPSGYDGQFGEGIATGGTMGHATTPKRTPKLTPGSPSVDETHQWFKPCLARFAETDATRPPARLTEVLPSVTSLSCRPETRDPRCCRSRNVLCSRRRRSTATTRNASGVGGATRYLRPNSCQMSRMRFAQTAAGRSSSSPKAYAPRPSTGRNIRRPPRTPERRQPRSRRDCPQPSTRFPTLLAGHRYFPRCRGFGG